MRNTRQYPITTDEILDVVHEITENPPFDPMTSSVGDLTPMIKNMLRNYLSKPETLAAIQKSS